MKPSLALFLIFFSSLASSVENPIQRCLWGHSHTDQVLKKIDLDPYYPRGLTNKEICTLAFEPDSRNLASNWIHSSLSLLPIPHDQLKPIEFLTREGQCQIGSILAQKRVKTLEENSSVILIARSVCKKMPKRLN